MLEKPTKIKENYCIYNVGDADGEILIYKIMLIMRQENRYAKE